MNRDISKAVVVIIGASSGIGRATALAFARQGARLVLAARDPDALDDVLGECTDLRAPAIAIPTDMTDESAVMTLRASAVDRFGKIDVWVNDAAVYMMGRFEDTPPDAFKAVLDMNVMGAVLGTRAALAQFRVQRRGTLITVGSVAGEAPYALASAYCASKHAISALMSVVRQEVRAEGIDICMILPATVDTPLFQHAANFTGREIVASAPMYPPERVAEAIVACAKRPRREVVVGAFPRFLQAARSMLPALFERLEPLRVFQKHLGEGRREEDMGNVPAPRPPHTTTGGWRVRRRRGWRLFQTARTPLLA
jgi:NADP-dependent 3-hydroxy acid dehydrogenase YdfG